MTECMNGVTGGTRHIRYTPADYVITKHSATAKHHWCRPCLLQLLRTANGEDVLSIEIFRTITTAYDRQRHARVLALHSQRKRDAVARLEKELMPKL